MTKKLLGVTFLGLACSMLPLAAAPVSDTISLDRGWLFRLGDAAVPSSPYSLPTSLPT